MDFLINAGYGKYYNNNICDDNNTKVAKIPNIDYN